jgi:GGDEF domain-containing protein
LAEEPLPWTEKPLGRYGVEYRLTLIVAGSAIGVMAFLATRSMSTWAGVGVFTAVLAAAWAALLLLHGQAAATRQRRIEALRRNRDLAERLVIYDRETRFYADWYFRLRLQEELVRSQRFGQSCALLLIEATEGRLNPEREKELLDCMANAFRETDLVAHMGSLRFVVLLPHTDASGAAVAQKRLLKRLPAGEVVGGVASYPKDGNDWQQLLAAAGASSIDCSGSPAQALHTEAASRLARRSDKLPA